VAGTPLLDVRAPVEYAQGSLPGSHNLPILTDAERTQVGLTYKSAGHAAAVALGHQLVDAAERAVRVARWSEFIAHHPHAQVMCWRGGQRSQLAQAWLAAAGHHVPRIVGGYKALRRVCVETLEAAATSTTPWWVIAGRTGVQKTLLIRQLHNSIDLEGLAHHRGSAFGAHPQPQPTPASFENALACKYLRHTADTVVLEDESRTIGRLALPQAWHARMQEAPLVLLEASQDARIAHIVDEYVTQALASGETQRALHVRYRDSLQRISRRLGGALHTRIQTLLDAAFANTGSHEAWVAALLQGYYDPMYDYQLTNKRQRIRFQGDRQAVAEFLSDPAP